MVTFYLFFFRMEFVRMKGPAGKGHAEMAVSKTKNSDYVTPDYDGDFPLQGWDQDIPLPGLLNTCYLVNYEN